MEATKELFEKMSFNRKHRGNGRKIIPTKGAICEDALR